MSFHYIKLPRPCRLSTYESAARKIAFSASKLTGVIAVYQIGNLASPGISDLDIVIVVDNVAEFSSERVLVDLSEEERYTLMHGLFCVNVEFWRNRHLFFKFDNLKVLFGQDVEPDNLPSNWLNWSTLRIATQHVIRVYASLSVQLFLNFLKVRSLLCELHALRYDFNALSPLLSHTLSREFSEYLEMVRRLRLRWFYNSSVMIRRFTVLCLNGKKLIVKLLEELNLRPEIRLEGYFTFGPTSRKSAKITTNRIIRASNEHVVDTVSGPVTALRYCVKGKHLADLAAMASHRIGQFTFGIPSHLFQFVVNSTWQGLDAERRSYIARRDEIISSHAWSGHARKSKQWSLPILDFIEK